MVFQLYKNAGFSVQEALAAIWGWTVMAMQRGCSAARVRGLGGAGGAGGQPARRGGGGWGGGAGGGGGGGGGKGLATKKK